jgi:hypothetical protein
LFDEAWLSFLFDEAWLLGCSLACRVCAHKLLLNIDSRFKNKDDCKKISNLKYTKYSILVSVSSTMCTHLRNKQLSLAIADTWLKTVLLASVVPHARNDRPPVALRWQIRRAQAGLI